MKMISNIEKRLAMLEVKREIMINTFDTELRAIEEEIKEYEVALVLLKTFKR